jgi:hypothetical protein
MRAYILTNGNIVAPFTAETGEVIGDALDVISPTHPDYDGWLTFAEPAPGDIEAEFKDREPRQT